MEIKADLVKQLRELTSAGMMEAKQALVEAAGDLEKAVELLRARGAAIAAKKAERVAANGVVASYIHGGDKIGVLVEVLVETDFVARDEKFVAFARDLAIHIAGMNPADNEELMSQPFVKDPSITVGDLLNQQVAFFKENIKIGRFVRMELGITETC